MLVLDARLAFEVEELIEIYISSYLSMGETANLVFYTRQSIRSLVMPPAQS